MAEFCASCGAALTPGARFCASCGTPTAISCASCGAELPDGAAFCPACGAEQSASPVELKSNEELRVITAMFIDLAGFTSHTERSEPEDVRSRLSIYHRRVREDVGRFGGRVEKLMGDGVFAVWGVPTAHEDDPERAVRTGLRIIQSIEDANAADDALELSVRIGIATGLAIVQLDEDSDDERIVGDVVNTASRLEGVAAHGTVVIDERTYASVKTAVDCTPLAAVEVKGKAGALPIWRAEAAKSRFGVAVDQDESTAFVGRIEELTLLIDAFERTIARRIPQLVTIVGEPGVGKSRLVRELFDRIDDRPDLTRWRQGRNLPYGEGVTFWALSEIVKSEAGILETESAERAAAKLDASVAVLAEDASDVDARWIRSRLAPLAGSGSVEGIDRSELFSAWLRYFELMAAKSPMIVVIEDLHWADDALGDFIEHVLDWGADAPILIVCTARPEWYDRRSGWGGGKREAVNVGLRPLSEEETGRLVAALAERASPLPERAQTALLEHSGGNPLYLTEYMRLANEEGWFEAVQAGSEPPLPDSVHAILAARLDRLDPVDKSAIQAAAVVGKVFWSGAVGFLRSIGDEAARESLHRLARRELIQPVRRPSMEGQEEYSFTHVLVRDVAYGQLPRGEKARLHRETGRWLEVVAAGRLIDVAELLAHHHATALDLEPSEDADLLERVYRFLMLAGERTSSLDLERARTFCRKAAAIAPAQADRARALLAAGRYPSGNRKETTDILTEAIAMFEQLDDRESLADALMKRSFVHWWGGEKTEAVDDSSRAMSLIADLPPSRVVANVMVGQAFRYQLGGEEEEALALAERARSVAQEIGDTDIYAKTLRVSGSALTQMGVQQGVDDLRESLRIDLDRGNTKEVMSSYNNLATYLGYIGDVAEALETIEAAIAYGEQRGAGPSVEWSKMTKCESLVQIGDVAEVASLADELAFADEERGGTQVGIFARQFWAWASWARGDSAGAWDAQQWVAEESYQIDDPQVTVPNLAYAIQFALAAGCLADAAKYIDDFIAVALANPGFVPTNIRRAAHGLIEFGMADGLRSVLTEALAVSSWEQALISSGQALLQAARGDHEDALERLLPAIEEADRRGIHFEATSLRVDAARSALAARRTDLAESLIVAGTAEAERMGAHVFIDALDSLVAGHSSPSDS